MTRIFENGIFFTPDGFKAGSLVCRDGTIESIGPDAAGDGAGEKIPLGGAIVLPGLVNAHGHSAMTLLRGLGSGLPLQRWLEEAIFPVEARLSPDDIRAGMRWAVAEMLACGTTCVADMYDFPEAGAGILEECGIKANVCRVGLDFPSNPGNPPGRLEECIEFVRSFRDPRGRVVADFCLHSEYLTTERFARGIAEANGSMRRPVHVHVSETAREHAECKERHGGETPVAYFARLGIFDHGAYCAHCVHCEDGDFRIMAEHGASLVHCPSSNMKLGSGFARIAAAAAAGVNVALGTDGCASNDNLNMIEEMHLAALLAKGLGRDPAALPAGDVIRMATANGARALGRADTGALAPGMRCDLCAISPDAIHMAPLRDPADAAVYAAQGADVSMTVVDGDILYRNGEFATIDIERAKAEFSAAVARLGGGRP